MCIALIAHGAVWLGFSHVTATRVLRGCSLSVSNICPSVPVLTMLLRLNWIHSFRHLTHGLRLGKLLHLGRSKQLDRQLANAILNRNGYAWQFLL